MKRLGFVIAFAALFMGVVPNVAPLVAGRTGSELGLLLLLNGERARTVQSDGGGLMLYTTDAGIASVSVTGGSVIYVECPTTAAHVCGPMADGTWDGGCSATVGDPNYGSPIASGGYRWISLRDATTTLKAVPASGSASVSCPVSTMR